MAKITKRKQLINTFEINTYTYRCFLYFSSQTYNLVNMYNPVQPDFHRVYHSHKKGVFILTRQSHAPVYSSKRSFYYEGERHSTKEKCCSQAIFHDKCHHCDKCDKCCKCDKCNQKPKHDHKDYGFHAPFSRSNSDAVVDAEAGEYSFMEQESAELIWVRESCDITINSTDTQVGLSLQAALQLAIAIVINITIADSNRSEAVSADLMQFVGTEQTNKQKIFIYNTKDANVTTTDTDLAVNLQVLLQILIAILIMVDIL